MEDKLGIAKIRGIRVSSCSCTTIIPNLDANMQNRFAKKTPPWILQSFWAWKLLQRECAHDARAKLVCRQSADTQTDKCLSGEGCKCRRVLNSPTTRTSWSVGRTRLNLMHGRRSWAATISHTSSVHHGPHINVIIHKMKVNHRNLQYLVIQELPPKCDTFQPFCWVAYDSWIK